MRHGQTLHCKQDEEEDITTTTGTTYKKTKNGNCIIVCESFLDIIDRRINDLVQVVCIVDIVIKS